MSKFSVVVVTLLVQIQTAFAGASIEVTYCFDAINRLDVSQAKGRNAWAMKCLPHLKYMSAKNDGNFYRWNTKTSEYELVYPILVQENDDGSIIDIQAPTDPAADCLDINRLDVREFCLPD